MSCSGAGTFEKEDGTIVHAGEYLIGLLFREVGKPIPNDLTYSHFDVPKWGTWMFIVNRKIVVWRSVKRG